MRHLTAACLVVMTTCAGAAFAQTPVPVDGHYAGEASLRLGGGSCDQTIPFKMWVKDRTFTWKLPTETVQVTIAPDGTFNAQNGQRFISGKIEGKQLTAATQGQRCNYAWSLTRD